MFAGAIGVLTIVIELVVMASYAPASMIPDLAPAALTKAADLAQSRIELEDPYVFLMFLGFATSVALSIRCWYGAADQAHPLRATGGTPG